MFNIGMGELILVAVVALIVLGPDKLPETARAFGKALREFKRAMNAASVDLEEPKPSQKEEQTKEEKTHEK